MYATIIKLLFQKKKKKIGCRAQKELVEREKREEDEVRKKRLSHADEVRAQIRKKEQERISERNAFFEEGVRLDEEARARRARLDEVKRKKLGELRWVWFATLVLKTAAVLCVMVGAKPLQVCVGSVHSHGNHSQNVTCACLAQNRVRSKRLT